MNRRKFFASTIAMACLGWVERSSFAQGATEEGVSIRWTVHKDHLDQVKQDLEWQGKIKPDLTSQRDTKGLPIFYILTGALGLVQLAKSLIAVVKDYGHGGLMVDIRGNNLVIKDLPSLDRGTILVVSNRGENFFRPKSDFDMNAFLKSLKKMP